MIRLHPYWSYHIPRIWLAWEEMLQAPWTAVKDICDPRVAPSEKVRLASYSSWFTLEEEVPMEELERGYPQGMARYIRHTGGIPYNHVQQLIRLRTGAHHLAIETGRWRRPSVPREDRLCTRCTSGEHGVKLLPWVPTNGEVFPTDASPCSKALKCKLLVEERFLPPSGSQAF